MERILKANEDGKRGRMVGWRALIKGGFRFGEAVKKREGV
jgi:hypothetical protein